MSKSAIAKSFALAMVLVGGGAALAPAAQAAPVPTGPYVRSVYKCVGGITGDGVNFRSGPGAGYAVYGSLYRGNTVQGYWGASPDLRISTNGYKYVFSFRHGRWGWVSSTWVVNYAATCVPA
ncbi:SH3 domain-containing protein [Embleya hyalina]|uniref:SH3b domain-containing protein n=1 Tax=Embleya hyalina TaxID=516124 RepID=A0A401YQV7_9ACTN|nr:SH3 domain-containing protein [Embleya hyalina]GCD97004.1 hypothetical protein EHYA_04691 [Embleya hyalina]